MANRADDANGSARHQQKRADGDGDGAQRDEDGHAYAKGRRPWMLEARSSITFVCVMAAFSLLTDIAFYAMLSPVAPYRLAELGYTDVARLNGWLISAYAVGLVLSSGPIGILGEVWPNRKYPLLAGLALMAAGLAMLAFGQNYATMLAGRVLQGVSGTTVWTLSLALVGDTVAPEHLGVCSGYVMIGQSAGSLIGPAAGGILYKLGGWHAPFIFAFGLLAIDLILRLLFIELKDAKAYGHSPPWSADRADVEDKEGSTTQAITSLLKSPRFLTVFATTFATGFIIGGLYDAGLTLYLRDRFDFDSLKAGLVYLAVVAPGFLTMPLAGHATDKLGVKLIGAIALALTIPATAALAILAPLAGFVVLLVLQGSAQSCLEPAMSLDLALLVDERPSLGFAHVYSLSNLAFSLGGLVGPAAAGHVLNEYGSIIAFVTAALVAICLLPWWLYVGPRRSKNDSDEERRPLLEDDAAPKKQRPQPMPHRSQRGIR